MANNTVEFRIGSKYNGEGFKQANDAIKKNRSEITSSTKGLGELANAFKQISPEAASAVTGVQKFANAFVSGGIVGGLISAAFMGINAAVEFGIKKFNEAKEATEKYAQILKDKVLVAMGESEAKFKSMKTAIEEANAEIKDSLALLNGETAREATNQVHKLHVETLQQITDDMSEAAKASLTAQEALKAQQIRGEAALKVLTDTLEAETKMRDNANKVREEASKRVVEAQKSVEEEERRCHKYLVARGNVLNALEAIERNYNDGMMDQVSYLKAKKKLTLGLDKIETEYKDDVERLNKVNKALETAKNDEKTAINAAKKSQDTLNTTNAKIETQKLENSAKETEATKKAEAAAKKKAEADEAAAIAAWEQSQAEREAEEAAKNRAEADDALFDKIMSEADAVVKATDATEIATKAQKENAEAMQKLTDAANKQADGMGNGGAGGGEGEMSKTLKNLLKKGQKVDVNVTWPDQMDSIPKPKKLDDETWNRFKNGLANAADMEKIARYQEREERDRQTARARQVEDSRRFLKIADMPETWRSPADNRFMETFKTQVLPRMSADQAAALLQEGGKHVMMKNDLKEFLGNQSELMKFLQQLGLK